MGTTVDYKPDFDPDDYWHPAAARLNLSLVHSCP